MTPHVSTTLLRTQTDARLVELIAAGHDRAFDAIVDRYRRPLMRYARRFLHEDTRAEDVVQSAFVSAWTALSDGATVRDLRPWLYRIVHNGALNLMKKPGRDDAILVDASDLRPGPAAEVEQREDVRQALDTISRLPERQRTALLAVAFDGRSHADVGEELGLKEPAVRQLVSRARTTLRVAATAITPWPVAAWLAGIGGAQVGDTAARVGEIAGGVGAGTVFGGGALKAGALVAAAGAVAVSAPKMAEVAHHHAHRPAVATADASVTPSKSKGHMSAGTPAAAAARLAAASGAARLDVVSSGKGALTAGVHAHRRSAAGGNSGSWSRSGRPTAPVSAWTPGGSGPSDGASAESTTVPAVTETPRSDRHAESESRGRQWSASTQRSGERRRGHSRRNRDGRRADVAPTGDGTSDGSRSSGSGTSTTTRDSTRRRSGGDDHDTPTTTPSTSGSDSGTSSGSGTTSGDSSFSKPDSGESSGSADQPDPTTVPAPAP